MLAGDFNLLDDLPLLNAGLFQIVYKPTRGQSTLDKMFISKPDIFQTIICCAGGIF